MAVIQTLLFVSEIILVYDILFYHMIAILLVIITGRFIIIFLLFNNAVIISMLFRDLPETPLISSVADRKTYKILNNLRLKNQSTRIE